MPRFVMTDIQLAEYPYANDYSDSQYFEVADRNEARKILARELANTADPDWSAAFLAVFDSGKDTVIAQNGPGATFGVDYLKK